MGIKTAFKNAVGVTDESTLRVDIEKCAAAVATAVQKAANAEKRHTLAIAAVKAENERLSTLAEAGEEPDLSALSDLEQAEGVAAKLLDFAHKYVDGAKARLAAAKTTLNEFLIEEAKSEASKRLTDLAAVITGPLQSAYAAAMKARSAAEARGIREWVAIPGIDSLLAAAAEMTRPRASAPAKPDPTRIMTFIQSARIDRGYGGHSFAAGETAGFTPELCGRLVFEGKAVWTYPGDPRQAELVEAARQAAESPRPQIGTSLTLGLERAGSYYVD